MTKRVIQGKLRTETVLGQIESGKKQQRMEWTGDKISQHDGREGMSTSRCTSGHGLRFHYKVVIMIYKVMDVV